MPKGINKQTPRARRGGAHSKHVSKTLNRSTPPSRPAVAAAPASSSEPAPARQSAPPASSSASSGSKRAEEASSASRPLTGPFSILDAEIEADFNSPATPAELLALADAMKDESEARSFLIVELRRKGWSEEALDIIGDNFGDALNPLGDSQVHFWIERFRTVVANMDRFVFQDWEHLAVCWDNAMRTCGRDFDIGAELAHVRAAEERWTSPLDKRCIRLWILGNLWAHFDGRATGMDPIAEWFDDFIALPVCERERPRRMWHDRAEQAIYDRLEAGDFMLHRGPTSEDFRSKFKYQEALSDSVCYVHCGKMISPGGPGYNGNIVVTRIFNKTSIIGVKRSHLVYDGPSHHAVTPRWVNSGLHQI